MSSDVTLDDRIDGSGTQDDYGDDTVMVDLEDYVPKDEYEALQEKVQKLEKNIGGMAGKLRNYEREGRRERPQVSYTEDDYMSGALSRRDFLEYMTTVQQAQAQQARISAEFEAFTNSHPELTHYQIREIADFGDSRGIQSFNDAYTLWSAGQPRPTVRLDQNRSIFEEPSAPQPQQAAPQAAPPQVLTPSTPGSAQGEPNVEQMIDNWDRLSPEEREWLDRNFGGTPR